MSTATSRSRQQSNVSVRTADVSSPKKAEKPKKKSNLFNRPKAGMVDLPLLGFLLLILLFGMVMLFSASYPTGHMRHQDSYAFILPQVKYALLGLGVMAVAALVDYHILKKFAVPLMALTVVLLIVVLFMEAKNNAHRWIWLNGSQTVSIQPSEIAKFAVILLFAALIANNQHRIKTFFHGFLPFVLILGMISALLLLEPHLSCTLLVVGIGVSMMFSGGTSLRWFVFAGILGTVGIYFLIKQVPDLVPYAATRVEIWQDPFSDPDGKGHQVIQSLIAVGSGGLTGSGIGNSVQKYLYLPEMYNDYIFAVICEELGFIGAMMVVFLFLLLLLRGLTIALRAKDKFGSMLAVGISVQIALQAFLHIAVNINAIPSTGISLPFFSSGGSSLVMLMGEMGILLSVSRQAKDSIELSSSPPRDTPEAKGNQTVPAAREA